MGCIRSYYCCDCCTCSYNLLHFIKSNFLFTVKKKKRFFITTSFIHYVYCFHFIINVQDKSSSDESRKKTDEPIPDVEVEASDEEQEADTKEDEEVDGKSADEEEENVCVTYFMFIVNLIYNYAQNVL